jgi:hypothetical protein
MIPLMLGYSNPWDDMDMDMFTDMDMDTFTPIDMDMGTTRTGTISSSTNKLVLQSF